MLLGAVDWDVDEEKASRIRGRGDFRCVRPHVDAVYGLDGVRARLRYGYGKDGVFSNRGNCFWHRGEAYAIEVREWWCLGKHSQGLGGRNHQKLKSLSYLSISCA